MAPWDATLLVLSTVAYLSCSTAQDNRCYLENGASSESFFVPEDLPVGTTIGQVRIHGDPRPGGTISLHLQENDSPVTIAPGTKNLTLRRRLDKEGVHGPSSVYVNLICERIHTIDPGFIIPVNIRVTDANDNSPEFINAPYVLNISEVTVVGTRVLQGVHAVDADQQGPFSTVKYSVLLGAHSDFFEFENELEGTLVLRKPLDYEVLQSFDVKIRAQDNGDPPRATDTVLTVHVLDADDQNPRFLDDRYSGTMPEPPVKGALVQVKPRGIGAFDQDVGINAAVYYSFNGFGSDYGFFKIQRNTGEVRLSRDVNSNDLQHPVTLVIRATQVDNRDRYALATLTVTLKDMDNAVRFLQRIFYVRVPESAPPGSTLSMLTNNKPGDALKYFVSDQEVLKLFTINTKGELVLKKRLDYEQRSDYVFKVLVTDGVTNDTSVVNVTVEDVNEWEPRFRYPTYEFFVAGAASDVIGRVEAADGDKSDDLVLTLTGMNASIFYITPKGELRLRDAGEYTGLASFAVVAMDSGNPPKKASVPVVVHFPGSGGAAARSSSGGTMVLAGLGAVLLILAFVIAFLVVYIYKAKKRASEREELPSMPPLEKNQDKNLFASRMRTPTASALGGVPSELAKSRIPSPKVHPAPQPPVWPHSALGNRVKKLSWGDKTDSDSNENIHNLDSVSKLTDNSNLTVYF